MLEMVGRREILLIGSISPEFVDVYYKNNVAQGMTMQSYYMVSHRISALPRSSRTNDMEDLWRNQLGSRRNSCRLHLL